MKTPGQRGPFGRWLTTVRSQRYETQADALRDFERLANLRISPSQYAQWESGSRVPKADNPKIARLYEFFGSSPETEDAEPSLNGEQPGIVAALERQAAAMERLAFALEQFVKSGASAQPPLSPEVQREVAEAEADLAARRGSETLHQPNVHREP